MPRTCGVYLAEQEIKLLDRLAKVERRSRSAMLREIIRRYTAFTAGQPIEQHPLFRDFAPSQLAQFLAEDRPTSSRHLAAYRKLLGLS
jgi:hypothetical protein